MSRASLHALLAAALACCIAAALPATAAGKRYDVPRTLGDRLPALVEASPVAVVLPQTLPLDYDGRLYGTARATSKGWRVELAGDPSCDGANACTLAWLSAERGAKRSNPVRVRLRGGRNGWFRPLSCGGSCSPPSIEFTRNRVLYEIQARVAQRGHTDRQLLVAAANSALLTGRR